MDKENQLDVTFVFFVSLLLFAQHVSGNHVPIIRSWRLRDFIASCWYVPWLQEGDFVFQLGKKVLKKESLKIVTVTIHKNINIFLWRQFNLISDGIIICEISGLYSTLKHGNLLTFISEQCVLLNSYPKLD
jgi:hypothetical protein